VIWCSGVSRPLRATYYQTASLATAHRNCDHIATMRCVTGGDRDPTQIDNVAIDQDQRGRDGMRRTVGDGSWKTTDLAVGVRIPRGAPANPQLSGPVTGSLLAVGPPDCDQIATTLAATPNPAATTCDHNRSFRP
jgi:hypothetical protein